MNYDPATYLELHAKKFFKFYENGVLKPSVHHRLVENATEYALEAGIKPSDIYGKFSAIDPTHEEILYVSEVARRTHDFPLYGLYYVGPQSPPVLDRMLAITGAMVRNFEPSRLLTQGQLFDMIMASFDLSVYRVLCLPDLMNSAGSIGEGLRRAVSTLIISRYAEGLQTCIGRVDNLITVGGVFGQDVSDLIASHYVAVKHGG